MSRPLSAFLNYAVLIHLPRCSVKRLDVGVTTPAEIDEILASANLDEDLYVTSIVCFLNNATLMHLPHCSGKRQVDPAAVNGYFAH